MFTTATEGDRAGAAVRRRLTLLTAITMSVVLLTFIVPLALLLRDAAVNRAVTAATTRAQSLATVSATTDRATLELTIDEINAYGYQMSVFLGDGTVVGLDAPRTDAVELAATGRSFTVEDPVGREIFFAAADTEGSPVVIRAFVTQSQLREGVARSWLVLGALGLALMLIGILVADRLASSLVRQITGVADVAHRLAAGQLDARAVAAGPREVQEVAGGLNQLAERIRVLLREERETVADLSHRLRTPLTALRLDAEALRDADEAARLAGDVDALERAVTRVITQARSGAGPARAGTCDAADVLRDRMAFWSVLAEDTSRRMQVDIDHGPVFVAVGRPDLEACVDALLGNVFVHTEDGVPFSVALHRVAPHVVRLTIHDEGKGIGALAEPLTERGTSGKASTGLGLDIARRTAEASGGHLLLESPDEGGTLVTIELGTPR